MISRILGSKDRFSQKKKVAKAVVPMPRCHTYFKLHFKLYC